MALSTTNGSASAPARINSAASRVVDGVRCFTVDKLTEVIVTLGS